MAVEGFVGGSKLDQRGWILAWFLVLVGIRLLFLVFEKARRGSCFNLPRSKGHATNRGRFSTQFLKPVIWIDTLLQ